MRWLRGSVKPSFAEDLTDRATVRRVLAEYGVRPSKRLGQSFLVSPRALRTIAETVAAVGPKHVVEIGPGLGTVTRELVRVCSNVVAIEIDRRLVEWLRRTLADVDSICVVCQDVLEFPFERADGVRVFVVGNVPYSLTAPILVHLVRHRDAIDGALLLTQTEVAQKVMASPGPGGSALGVTVRAYADTEKVAVVKRGGFEPIPDVDSMLWKVSFLPHARFGSSEEAFFAVVRTIYGARRKMLRSALRALVEPENVPLVLDRAQVDGRVRGETLAFEALDRLAAAVGEVQTGKPS